MKIKVVFILVSCCIMFVSCVTQQRIFEHNYVMHDSPQRFIVVNLNSDSTFLLRNAVHGNLSYSLVGDWREIDGKRFVLINNTSSGNSDGGVIAPPQGGKINVKEAVNDRRHVFPALHTDTIIFSGRYQSFTLKGYKFRIGKRVK